MKKHLILLYLAISASGSLTAEELPVATPLPDYPRVAVETNAGNFVMELFGAQLVRLNVSLRPTRDMFSFKKQPSLKGKNKSKPSPTSKVVGRVPEYGLV